MTQKRRVEPEHRAREFIDEIIRISRRHGMGGEVPQAIYEGAVKGSADAYRTLLEATMRQEKP